MSFSVEITDENLFFKHLKDNGYGDKELKKLLKKLKSSDPKEVKDILYGVMYGCTAFKITEYKHCFVFIDQEKIQTNETKNLFEKFKANPKDSEEVLDSLGITEALRAVGPKGHRMEFKEFGFKFSKHEDFAEDVVNFLNANPDICKNKADIMATKDHPEWTLILIDA